MSRLVGASPDGPAPRLMRLLGVREVAQGVAILTRPRPTTWMWSRVAGDGIDLALLGLVVAKNRNLRTAFAIANVLAVTVPDVYESRFLSRKQGPPRSEMLVRKAVTVSRSRDEVEQAWHASSELRQKVEEARARVTFADAPGDRGTELIVEFEYDPTGGDLGGALQKVLGRDLATQLSDDLRRLKQQIETGEVVRSDGAPGGHLLAEHLKQRAAQPLEEAIR